jgi:hypothetical protein
MAVTTIQKIQKRNASKVSRRMGHHFGDVLPVIG